MVYRNTALAAAAVLGFALLQLGTLLRSTETGTPWQVTVTAALLLGTVITWAGLAYRLHGAVVALCNLVPLTVIVFRVATPETTRLLLPTAESVTEMRLHLSQALAIIRNGIEPVVPVPGLVVIVAVVMWVVGVLVAYGLQRGRPALAVVPGLVLAAQFTTMARTPTGPVVTASFVIVLAAAILAVTSDERRATSGRMAHATASSDGRRGISAATFAALSVTLVGSLFTVGVLRATVPADGMVEWRATSGLSVAEYGSVAYNPFVSIRNQLVSDSDVPVFQARIQGDAPPGDVYFRLLTMEEYNGTQFTAGGPQVVDPESGPWEDPRHAFAGPTAEITATVAINRLRMAWLPAPYSPRSADGDDTLWSALRVRTADASLVLEGGTTHDGMSYAVTADVPRPDLATLATGADGTLSPLFAAAGAAGEPGLAPTTPVPVRPEPPDAARYLFVPETMDPGIAALARAETARMSTPFEQALALEAWLRSDEFEYTTSIPPGHAAGDLAEWLLPRYADRPFHRAGYCETFATAMAVMARTLGIHSRVVLGFTPGDPIRGDPGAVVVRDRNAHAWVELWMPNQGWVRFDPTPRGDSAITGTGERIAAETGFDPMAYVDDIGRGNDGVASPPVGRVDPPDVPNDPDIDLSLLEDPPGAGWSLPDWPSGTPLVLVAVVLALAGIPTVKRWQRRRRFRRLRNGDVTAAWEEIVARLTDQGRPPHGASTPDELADSVGTVLRPLASVYGRAVYGSAGSVAPAHVRTAEQSMEQTVRHLDAELTTWQRIRAWYHPGSVLPRRSRNGPHR